MARRRTLFSNLDHTKFSIWLPWVLVGIIAIIYSVHSLWLHWSYYTHAWDLGIYDQQVWLSSHTFSLYNTVRGTNLLSDHFGLTLYLLAPLYWLWSHPETLLIAQAIIVAVSGYPLYRLAEKLFQTPLAGLAFSLAYYVSAGVIGAVHFDVHLATFGVIFLAWFIYWLVQGRYWLAFGALVLGSLTKEDFALYFMTTALAFGLFLPFQELIQDQQVVVVKRFTVLRARLISFGMALASALGFVAIFKLMKYIPSTDANFDYFSFQSLGTTYKDVVKNFLSHPVDMLKTIWSNFIHNRTKVGSLLVYAQSYICLPFFAPFTLALAAFPFFLTKYVSDRDAQWGLNGQYAISGMVLMTLAAILAGYRFVRLANVQPGLIKQLSVLVSLFVVVFSLQTSRDFWSSFHPSSWASISGYRGLNQLISQIPSTASVATQDQIVPHVSGRQNIYLIGCPVCNNPILEPDYLVLDTRFGSSFQPKDTYDIQPTIHELLENGRFEGRGQYELVGSDIQPAHQSYLFHHVN